MRVCVFLVRTVLHTGYSGTIAIRTTTAADGGMLIPAAVSSASAAVTVVVVVDGGGGGAPIHACSYTVSELIVSWRGVYWMYGRTTCP